MGVYNIAARYMLAPVLDALRGTSTIRCLAELERTQWWSREQLLELQSRRLRVLLQYAYERVPFYRRAFDDRGLTPADINTASDLSALPVLNRRDVRRHSAELQAMGFPGRRRLVARTSGSTGEPLAFCTTLEDRYSWGYARSLRALRWSGFRLGDSSIKLVEQPESSARRVAMTADITARLQRETLFDVRDMSGARVERLVVALERHNPALLRGYPSAVYLLALHIRSRGGSRFRPRSIVTAGEPLYDHQREVIADVFGLRPFSKYSSHEVLDIACECPAGAGFHVAAENVIVEVLDDEGQPVPPGTVGRIVVTNLHNYCMPFIRYELGDIGAMAEEQCACGRGLPLLRGLEGRRSDILITPEGGQIPGIVLPWSFLAEFGVDQLQIEQERIDAVKVRLVLNSCCDAESAGRAVSSVKSRYESILGPSVRVEIEVVPKIATTSRGKRAVVISSIAGKKRA
ncbi:MAG: phenylacetate--CoA ligase family protein [Chloroflexi bacterium]|nr:phenylacetate--CoA ligase family protein [Chloroflexota bacterium]